jgi:hypothetical protein
MLGSLMRMMSRAANDPVARQPDAAAQAVSSGVAALAGVMQGVCHVG